MKLFYLVIFLIPMVSWAQPNNTGNWFICFGDKKINPKWNLHHEIQYRNFNFAGDTEQLLARVGIGYNLTEHNNNFLVGYGYIYTESYTGQMNEKINFGEHRLFQQFITRSVFSKVSIQHRYRFEQRIFEDKFLLRCRYFLSLNFYFNPTHPEGKSFYLSAYNEIFLNTKQNIFDRNRLYGGVGYRFSKNIRTEIGFLNQSTNTTSRNQFNLISFFNF